MVGSGTIIRLPTSGEIHEILATPDETRDRYRVRTTFEPQGRGPSPHQHPGLVEHFEIESGTMTLRVGRHRRELTAGETTTVPPNTVHAMWNPTDAPAVIIADIVFTPPGPRPAADIMRILELDEHLDATGRLNPRTRNPQLLQMAVVLDEMPEAIALPGPLWLQRAMLRPLAKLGRRQGYRTSYPPEN